MENVVFVYKEGVQQMKRFGVGSQLSSKEFQPVRQSGIELWKLCCAQYCAWAAGVMKANYLFLNPQLIENSLRAGTSFFDNMPQLAWPRYHPTFHSSPRPLRTARFWSVGAAVPSPQSSPNLGLISPNSLS